MIDKFLSVNQSTDRISATVDFHYTNGIFEVPQSSFQVAKGQCDTI